MNATMSRRAPMPARRRRTRWLAIARVAVAMMLHDRMKLAGGLVGVVFAALLATEQAGILFGLIGKNTMVVDRAGADIWILPQGSEQPQPGKALPEAVLNRARTTADVAIASPLIWAGGTLALPNGGTEPVTLLGVDPATRLGGPWNVVAGDPASLVQPDAMIFEDSQRDKLGALNLGSLRELNGKRVRVVGFTWGLLPFGPSYAFTSYDNARELISQRDHSQSMVLVTVKPGVAPSIVAARLRAALPEQAVFTQAELRRSVVLSVLTNTPIGITFGLSALFGLVVGFVIVAMSMFSAVVDNLREFGTLKAIGSTTGDLARLLLVQALFYGLSGSAIGLAAVGVLASVLRSPSLAVTLPIPLVAAVPMVMAVICVAASFLALWRLHKLEPGMVFRG